MTTEIITPDSLGRPIAAYDVQEGDTVVLIPKNDSGSTEFRRYLIGPGDSVGSFWRICSITRPVAEQPALPTEPGFYLDSIQNHIYINEQGQIYRNSVRLGANPIHYLPWQRLVPAGSEREAALQDVTAKFRELGLRGAVDVMYEHFAFALVPEAEEEKQHPYGRDCSNKCREDAARLAEGEKA